LDNARRQRPVRRVLRVKTVEALPRPMPPEIYGALLSVLRTRRDRALLELMWEGGVRPGEVLGLCLEDISYSRRRITVCKRNDHLEEALAGGGDPLRLAAVFGISQTTAIRYALNALRLLEDHHAAAPSGPLRIRASSPENEPNEHSGSA
jgi:integrase